MGVFVGEVVSEIAVSSLIYLLVMAMPWPTVAASVPTTVVTTSCPATAVVWRATAAMCARPWRGPTSVGLVRSDFRVRDSLRSSYKVRRLPHGRDQVCSYTGPETLAFWRVWESIEICHGDSYISAQGLEDWLVSHHVGSIIEIVWDQLLLLFFCTMLGAIGITLLALLPLIIYFSVED